MFVTDRRRALRRASPPVRTVSPNARRARERSGTTDCRRTHCERLGLPQVPTGRSGQRSSRSGQRARRDGGDDGRLNRDPVYPSSTVGKLAGTLNVTEAERRRIRQLYRQGVRVTEIVEITGRCDSVVSRTVRGMHRRKPPPPRSPRIAKRNVRIVELVLDKRYTIVRVAGWYGLTPTRVCEIVQKARKALRRAAARRARARRPTPPR